MSSRRPIPGRALIRSVRGMDNLLNLIDDLGRVSTLVFGAMVVTALAVASISAYRRRHRRYAV